MMSMNKGSLDYWRKYFRGAKNADIFDIIGHAIMVAASDCPKEFKLKRDAIAERLFSCCLNRCAGCDGVELAEAAAADDGGDEGGVTGGAAGGFKSGIDGDDAVEVELEAGAKKEGKVNSSGDDDHGEMKFNHVSNYSYGEAEALTDEIEEESQYVDEVFRIKEVLLNCEEESDSVLFESLRRLQLMELTVDLLKATEIGKTVNPLRKHGSRDVRQLARTLIDGWKEMVDEWVKATAAIAGSEGSTPDSVNLSVVDDEEGLPSPPMDEGALFAAPTGSMDISQFFDGMDDAKFFDGMDDAKLFDGMDDAKLFDGMDDDGNPPQSGEFIKNREDGRRPSLNSQNTAKRKPQTSNEANILSKDSKGQQTRKSEAPAVRINKPVTADSVPGRPPKSTMQKKGNAELKLQENIARSGAPNKPHVRQQDKFKSSDDAAVQVKLEATKRKLQERYQQVENAKRQRTVQVMELHDLPKQGTGHRNPHFKAGNQKRQWAQGRR